ncbi:MULTISPECIES: nucleoside hydrolase [Mammaliicoccus]|uniref:Nucleoside hydrolase n=1 Tax=Mammaliicoccus fleurettii TaxID=150056 RepID=A0ABS5MR81_9STAP|nr:MULTISPECIES: nucleoside hydrolase [Mammaliicoccus]HCN61187.1 ribonucleoside hydrolase RihC [Staphylococcus sp.]MBL0848297.1 nucleoside hydrolase [Mammaliicoccus fleurettii]MBS3673060.1 nucleoside hydrolase [Mammaliicoccus fleurettii]MBS3698177.1 nucleoside hydrolase [Mammaliicoccus fleurettii]RTX89773.1 ribonucleoside hydrolase RihC [Mammaliicoccus fleurettii]
MAIPIIIDTDPGIDDMIAISAAIHSKDLDVKLITSVGGNVGIEHTTQNALDIVNYFKKDIPVAKGVDTPLINKLATAEHVHGHNGIGNVQFMTSSQTNILEDHAVIAMKETIMNSEEPITLVPIGPLTNIALLFSLFPETKSNIKQIVLMGGSAVGGNATPLAEFNIYVDPHAAQIVFNQDIPIVMCGLDVTRETIINHDDIQTLKKLGDFGNLITDMLEVYNDVNSGEKHEHIIHDLCTIFYLLYPEMFTTERANVSVITEGQAAGCTYTEFNKEGKVEVCMHANNKQFREKFVEFVKDIHQSR